MFNKKLDQKHMSKTEKRAYWTWSRQRKRCNNPKDSNYKYYGLKGIKVEYTSREFIGWYLKNYPKIYIRLLDVGRIDHNKNYSLNNIQFQSREDNSKERNERLGNPIKSKPVKIIEKNTGYIFYTKSLKEAQDKTGIYYSDIAKSIKYKKNNRKYIFEYMEVL